MKSDFLPFEEAKEYARSLELKSSTDWKNFSSSGKRPENIPSSPREKYKDKGWISWSDFLGYEKTEFLPYEQAREFARNLKFISPTEWTEWSKSGMRPSNIPGNPAVTYKNKGWKSWTDFLGNEFLPFEEAREFTHSLNLKTEKEWKKWSKSGMRPSNIPGSPNIVYKNKGWKSWTDFLGNEFLPFEEAREYARSLNLKTQIEWQKWSKSGMRPSNIPGNPAVTYKNKGWLRWGDFLGNNFLPFEEAREYTRSLKFISSTKWKEWSKSGMRPSNIPGNPAVTYKNKGWKSWGDFLGNEFLPYEEAREFVRSLNLKNKRDWEEWSKNGMRPSNIPSTPNEIYKDKGWKSWADFLGNGNIASYNIKFSSFEEAREFVRSLELKNIKEWKEYCKSGKKPKDIPNTPDEIYKNKGWKGRPDFFGTNILTYEEAKSFVHPLNIKGGKKWKEYCKSGKKPKNIPSNAAKAYKDKGWKGWADFLGYLGNGNAWTKKALLAFLEDIKDCLHTCSMAQILTIIEACGLINYIPFEMLYEIQETESNSPERIQLVSNIISEVVYGDSHESVNGLSEEASLVEAQLSEGASIVSILDNIYDSQLSQINQIKYLTSLENESITAALDEDKIQFLVTESINTLWYSVMNNQLDVEEIKSLPLKGKVPTRIIQTFYKEYKSVMNLKLPRGWSYPHKPLLMQKLITYRLSQRKRYGNWSSVGSGKTIGAILAGRYVGAKNTLIITFNSTIGNEDERGWMKEIRDSFKDSNIYTKADKNIDLSNGGYNYLILNYETFQQATSADFVIDLLKRNTFDYIVLDEVQSIKNRGGSVSKRRDLIMGLIDKIKKNNPDYYLLAMSATPVINNSMEAKSLIQLIEMNEMEDISTTENIGSWLQLYRKMTHYGIRYKDHNDNILKGNQYTIIDVEADELYPLAASIRNEDILLQDQLVLDAKLHAVLPYINTSIGKTIIYTHFVKDIDERIYEYLTERGFKAGLYTGSESKLNRESALNEFIDGDIDVLIASRPLATGVDGLQKISDREIIISLPWTHAEFIQFVGRISRKGSIFSETGVDVIIPLVSINGIGHSFRWDYRKYNLITYKETIANAVVDGIIPKKITKTKEEIISYADDSISEWIERIKEKDDVKLKTP